MSYIAISEGPEGWSSTFEQDEPKGTGWEAVESAGAWRVLHAGAERGSVEVIGEDSRRVHRALGVDYLSLHKAVEVVAAAGGL